MLLLAAPATAARPNRVNRSWGGYEAVARVNAFREIDARWTEPQPLASCSGTSGSADLFWAGLGDNGGPGAGIGGLRVAAARDGMAQAGIQDGIAFLAVTSRYGTALLDEEGAFRVRPGDVIASRVVWRPFSGASGEYVLKVLDRTTGRSIARSVELRSSQPGGDTAEVVTERAYNLNDLNPMWDQYGDYGIWRPTATLFGDIHGRRVSYPWSRLSARRLTIAANGSDLESTRALGANGAMTTTWRACHG